MDFFFMVFFFFFFVHLELHGMKTTTYSEKAQHFLAPEQQHVQMEFNWILEEATGQILSNVATF